MTDTQTIEWTRQHRRLWTGRRDGKPIGMIEHGSHYTLFDLNGDASRGFRTLIEAQQAAEVA